jgi:hypothetical protein
MMRPSLPKNQQISEHQSLRNYLWKRGRGEEYGSGCEDDVFDDTAASGYSTNQEIERGDGQPTPTFQFENPTEKRVKRDRQDETSKNLRGDDPRGVLACRLHVRLHGGSAIHTAPLNEVSEHASDVVSHDVNNDRSRSEECKCLPRQLGLSSPIWNPGIPHLSVSDRTWLCAGFTSVTNTRYVRAHENLNGSNSTVLSGSRRSILSRAEATGT